VGTKMQVIIGTSALNHFNVSPRTPKDLDVFVSSSIESKDDWHIIPEELLVMIPQQDGYATPDAVYTLKMSHAAWDIHWEKTAKDICFLSNFCTLIPDLYWAFHNYWKTVHGGKDFLSLKKNKDEFFTDNVTYYYDHDWLHEVVARPLVPAYKSALADSEDVMIDKVKFFNLPKNEQLRMFREEIKVIALERWCIPSGFKIHPYTAYYYSVKKTITNLTKNWATLFILENLKEIFKLKDNDWFLNFQETSTEERRQNWAKDNLSDPPVIPAIDQDAATLISAILFYYKFDDITHDTIRYDVKMQQTIGIKIKDVVETERAYFKTGQLIIEDRQGTLYSLPFLTVFELYSMIDIVNFRQVAVKTVTKITYQ